MTKPHGSVSRHYSVGDLERQILAALEADGKVLDALTVEDLAPVDEFHIRGRKATEELAAWAELHEGQKVLDVGCGLGGTSRVRSADAVQTGERVGDAIFRS
jgi:2-polyprenyl-3-methyl-5-hydroxy-6-metoxy-1,4-benzoquinol methylase